MDLRRHFDVMAEMVYIAEARKQGYDFFDSPDRTPGQGPRWAWVNCRLVDKKVARATNLKMLFGEQIGDRSPIVEKRGVDL